MGTNDDLCLDRCVVGASAIAGVHDAQAKILNQEWPSCSIHQASVLIGSMYRVVSSLHAFLFVSTSNITIANETTILLRKSQIPQSGA